MKKLLLLLVLIGFTHFTVIGETYATPTSESKEIEQKKKSKQSELKKTESDYDKMKKEIQKLEKDISEYDTKMESLHKALLKQKTELAKQEKKLDKRLKDMYLQGEWNYMSKLITANSFGEFLYRLEVLRVIVKTDSKTIDEYKKIVSQIEKKQSEMQKVKKQQAPLLAQSQKKLKAIESKLKTLQKDMKKINQEEQYIVEHDSTDGSTGNGTGIMRYPSTPGMTFWNFGQNRGTHNHQGIDIPRGYNTPIYAADSGTVVKMKSNPGGFGYYIVISHGNGISTLYGHMYRSTVVVSIGQKVQKGQRIAGVGDNGRGGMHLHFEVHKNGVPVNPKPYL